MKLSILIFPLLFIAHAESHHNEKHTQETLLSNIEQRLEQILLLNNHNDVHRIINNIKTDLELLKAAHTQPETSDDFLESFRKYCGDFSKTETSHEAPQPQPLMRMNDYHVEKCTPDDRAYRFFSTDGSTFRFKLRASNDGHIALSRDNVGTHPMYEVILGGTKNTYSGIRYNAKDAMASFDKVMLQECEYISFWIRWDAGHIQVGYDKETNPFLSYNATNFYKVNYIGIHTGFGSTGSWIF